MTPAMTQEGGGQMVLRMRAKFILVLLALSLTALSLTALSPTALSLTVPSLTSGAAQSQSVTFRSVEGREVKLSDLKGKVVVMSFGGTWVPMAARELPAFQKLADRYSSRGVQA